MIRAWIDGPTLCCYRLNGARLLGETETEDGVTWKAISEDRKPLGTFTTLDLAKTAVETAHKTFRQKLAEDMRAIGEGAGEAIGEAKFGGD